MKHFSVIKHCYCSQEILCVFPPFPLYLLPDEVLCLYQWLILPVPINAAQTTSQRGVQRPSDKASPFIRFCVHKTPTCCPFWYKNKNSILIYFSTAIVLCNCARYTEGRNSWTGITVCSVSRAGACINHGNPYEIKWLTSVQFRDTVPRPCQSTKMDFWAVTRVLSKQPLWQLKRIGRRGIWGV